MNSSSKPLNPSGDDESHDDSMDHETLKVSFFQKISNFNFTCLIDITKRPKVRRFCLVSESGDNGEDTIGKFI